jgi:hypothetical protein
MSSLLRHLLNSGAPVARILAHKIVALAILFGVGVYFLIIPAFTNQLGANPIERLFTRVGRDCYLDFGRRFEPDSVAGALSAFRAR